MRCPIFPCLIALFSFASFLLAVGCGSKDAGDGGPSPIKVGAIFALTGATSDVGTT